MFKLFWFDFGFFGSDGFVLNNSSIDFSVWNPVSLASKGVLDKMIQIDGISLVTLILCGHFLIRS